MQDMTNPLDGYNYTMGSTSGMYQYYMQVVPTDYNYLNGKTMSTNQFSVTDHMRKLDSRQGRGLPGVFFFYDVSPIRVRIVQSRRSFTSFLTSVCAIIGGVFTVRPPCCPPYCRARGALRCPVADIAD